MQRVVLETIDGATNKNPKQKVPMLRLAIEILRHFPLE